MKVIIIPLNKFFYNFEKYDGSTSTDRFWERHPRIIKLFRNKVIAYSLCGIIFILMLFFYVFPVFLFYYLFLGSKLGNNKNHDIVDKFGYWTENLKIFQKKDIRPTLIRFKNNNYSLMVYYTPEMAPVKKKKQKIFFDRIELMKQKLKIDYVHKASSKEDIEAIILTYGIDVSTSFFMSDGKINLSNIHQLKEGSIPMASVV